VTAEEDIRHLLLSLLQGFYWFDEGLQNYLQARGWPAVTRPQSMVMANVVLGVRRPSDIARNMGVSRQAIHATINQMIGLGMVALVDDPVEPPGQGGGADQAGRNHAHRRASAPWWSWARSWAGGSARPSS
jgi:hypothetical protein